MAKYGETAGKWQRENPEAARKAHQLAHARRRQSPEWVERQHQYGKQWRDSHRTLREANGKRRWQRLKAAEGDGCSERQWHAIKRMYGFRCSYCGETPSDSLQTDHVVPLVHHGEHSTRNIVPCCGPCNTRKGARIGMPFQVIPSIGRDHHVLLLRSAR